MQAFGLGLRSVAGPGTVRHAWLRRCGAAFLSGLVLTSVAAPSAFAAKSGGTISTAPVTGKFAVTPSTVVVGSVTTLTFSFSGTTSGSRTVRIAVPSSFSVPQTGAPFNADTLAGIGWVGNVRGCLSMSSGDQSATDSKTSPRYIQFVLGCTKDASTGSVDFAARASATGSQKFPVYVAPSTTAFATLAVSAANGKVALTAADMTAGVPTQLSAKVTDSKGIGVAGVPVRFSDSQAATFSAPQIQCPDLSAGSIACTDANGVARMTISATIAGTHRLNATILGTSTGTQKSVAVVPGPVSTVSVSGDAADLVAGDPRTITVSARDAYANPVSLASGHSVALAQGVTDSGTVTGLDASVANGAARDFTVVGGEVGAVTLGATVDGVDSTSGTLVGFDVVAGTLAIITFDAAQVTLTSGDVATAVTLHGADGGGNAVDLSASSATIEQSGSGTVLDGDQTPTDDGGLSIDLTGVTEGTGLLTATIDGTSATLAFTVLPGALDSIRLDGSRADLTSGGSRTFTILGLDAAGNAVDITGGSVAFAPASGAVGSVAISSASVAGRGLAYTVTGGLAGPVVLEATLTLEDESTLTDSADLLVVVGDPILSVTVPAGDLTSGQRWTVVVAAADAAGNPIAVTDGSLVAGGTGTVAIAGGVPSGNAMTYEVTGETAGTIVLLAAFGDVTAGSGFLVVPSELASITLTASAASVEVDGPITFTVAGFDLHGNPVALDRAAVSLATGGEGTLTIESPAQAGLLVTAAATATGIGVVTIAAQVAETSLVATTEVAVTAIASTEFQTQATRASVRGVGAPRAAAPAQPALPATAAPAASAAFAAGFPTARPTSVVRGR